MRILPLGIPAALALTALCGAQRDHRFDHEHVLGTSLSLVVQTPDADVAARAEKLALEEIARLDAILSHHRTDSELSRFAASHEETEISADLLAALSACELWRYLSGGAFETGIAELIGLWRAAKDAEPDAAAISAARDRAAADHWRIDPKSQTATRLDAVPLDLDGLAKGYVLDAVVRKLVAELPADTAVLLDIGGDVRVAGATERVVAIADPRHPADNAAPRWRIRLAQGAVATSGGYARGFDVAGEHRSHILDPRTGRPVTAVLGATVVAPDATTADALATILNVLGPKDGLALLADVQGAAAWIVAADGTEHASPEWSEFAVPGAATAPIANAWPAGFGLAIDFEIADPSSGGSRGRGRGRRGGGKRPYVAVWIETPDGEAVRTLCLWIERERWLRDLRRWSRLHRDRQDFVETVSRATRRPGAYDLVWDGRDDAGEALPLGEYVVLLEAAREHGTYQLIRQTVTLGAESFTKDLEGNVEISAAHLRYGPHVGGGR